MRAHMQGVPPPLRAWVWMEVSGAAQRKAGASPSYFAGMAAAGASSPFVQQIEQACACCCRQASQSRARGMAHMEQLRAPDLAHGAAKLCNLCARRQPARYETTVRTCTHAPCHRTWRIPLAATAGCSATRAGPPCGACWRHSPCTHLASATRGGVPGLGHGWRVPAKRPGAGSASGCRGSKSSHL